MSYTRKSENKCLRGLTVLVLGALLCNAVSAAQTSRSVEVNPNATPEHSTRIIFLGTNGGPTLNIRRSEPATLLVVDGEPFLIDAGAGLIHQLAMAGYYPNQVRHVFITHNHLDHNAGLEPFMSEAWLAGNQHFGGAGDYSAAIYGPPDTKQVFDAALKYVGVAARIFGYGKVGAGGYKMPPDMFSVHTISKDGQFYDDGTVRVSAAQNTHFVFPAGSPPAKAGDVSYSYRFDTPNGAVVFTGDTGPSSAVKSLVDGADVLVSEVIDMKGTREVFGRLGLDWAELDHIMDHMKTQHLTPEEIGKMAQADGVKTVILYHLVLGGIQSLTDIADTHYVNTSRLTAGVKQYFSGQVIVSQDGFEYDLYQDVSK